MPSIKRSFFRHHNGNTKLTKTVTQPIIPTFWEVEKGDQGFKFLEGDNCIQVQHVRAQNT